MMARMTVPWITTGAMAWAERAARPTATYLPTRRAQCLVVDGKPSVIRYLELPAQL